MAENAEKEELMKERYAQLRMAAVQIKQAQQQLEALEEKKAEIEMAVSSIDELAKSQKNTKMLVPVSDGMFARATLETGGELIVNVGSNVCVKKTAEEAKEMLRSKLQEIAGYQQEMLDGLNKLTEEADKLETELGMMLQEQSA